MNAEINGAVRPANINIKLTPRIMPGGANELIFTNAENGDYLGDCSIRVQDIQLAPTLAAMFANWVRSQVPAVAPVPAVALDVLKHRQ